MLPLTAKRQKKLPCEDLPCLEQVFTEAQTRIIIIIFASVFYVDDEGLQILGKGSILRKIHFCSINIRIPGLTKIPPGTKKNPSSPPFTFSFFRCAFNRQTECSPSVTSPTDSIMPHKVSGTAYGKGWHTQERLLCFWLHKWASQYF